MSTKKRRRGAPRRDEPSAHARLVETATELFYQEGIRAIGIDTVVARSGVSKSSLYRTFASKDDLIAAFAEEENRRFGSGGTKLSNATAAHRRSRSPRCSKASAVRSQARSFEAAHSSILPLSFRIVSTQAPRLLAPTSEKCASDCVRLRTLLARAIPFDWQINSLC